ncbi:MAG TPA: thiamine pyrophosphate-dependent enzyme, partial [Bacteroidales bacterium]|nr:thiamine pyrophosphate-dependent enzyme [Bacteroidales bacterium]
LIVIGSDFPYHDFYPDNDIPTIQIDNKADQIGRRHIVSNPLPGDAKLTLTELLPLVSKSETGAFLKKSQEDMQKWIKEQDKFENSSDVPLRPQTLASTISKFANEDAIICCDTGAVTVWGARNFKLRGSQRFTLSANLASMGFGLPAAIGAQLAFPDRQVIALCGDGGFAMLMGDFVTAVKYNLPIKIFIFNNGKLGLIQMEEEARSGNPEYQTDLLNPDYAAYAEICGGEGFTIKEPYELESVIKSALKSSRPCIINSFVNPDELTMPPKVSFSDAVNYGKAKIKEFFIRHKSK